MFCQLIGNDTERMVGFVGRFVEASLGKTLFTVATTTVILAEPDWILVVTKLSLTLTETLSLSA